MNNFLKKYAVPIEKVAEISKKFDFEIEKKFFEHFELTKDFDGNVLVEVTLIQSASTVSLDFEINGYIHVECDRCLDLFDWKINTDHKMYVKKRTAENKKNDNTVWIDEGSNSVNVAHPIYEILSLSLPIRFVHPIDGKQNLKCNPEMLEKIKTLAQKKTTIDPRWEVLKKMKKTSQK